MSSQNRAPESKETIFLTRREAVRAIHMDFVQYQPQIQTWKEISPIVFGANVRLVEDSHARRLWLAVGHKRRMRALKEEELGPILIKTLEKSDIPINDLASVCGRVFRTNVHAGRSEDGNYPGVYVETGMEDFFCKKCGKCCRTLDYHDQFTEQDYLRWQELGRKDLLEWVRPIHKKERTCRYRIWVPPGSISVSPTCPWLRPVKDKKQWECAIHDVKPKICRQYPGTRKHAKMTGCPGFD